MTKGEQLLWQKEWRWIDESLIMRSRSPVESFAQDDTICHLVGQGMSPPSVRTWVHDRSVILGLQDARMPYIEEAVDFCKMNGYRPIVRNSGGLAVVLDEGILNVTLTFSEREERLSIDDGYEAMLAFVQLLFPEAEGRIEAYEVVGSYCPGSYDLSIDGKKFAGISQRRIRKGIAVQVYLGIEGSGSERAAFIRNMYERGIQGEETKTVYPDVQPHVMATLNELLDETWIVSDIVHRIQIVLHELADERVVTRPYTDEELELYMHYLQRMMKRSAKLNE